MKTVKTAKLQAASFFFDSVSLRRDGQWTMLHAFRALQND